MKSLQNEKFEKDSFKLVRDSMERLQSRSGLSWEGYKGSGLQPTEVISNPGKTVEDLISPLIPKFDADAAVHNDSLAEFMKQWNEQNKKAP